MDHHRHVQIARELEERQRFLVIGIVALKARRDPGTLEPVFGHGALELPQEGISAIGVGRGKTVDRVVLVLLLGDIAVVARQHFQLAGGIVVAQPVQRIADTGDIDAARLLRLKDILDRMRRRPFVVAGREDPAMKRRVDRGDLILRREYMGVEIDNHGGTLSFASRGLQAQKNLAFAGP